MKAIMMSIKPQHVANILNGLKTLEIRRRFPSDYVGWVYIYCTKVKPFLFQEITYEALAPYPHLVKHPFKTSNHCPEPDTELNGKVVARFWCDRVDEILSKENGNFYTNALSNRKLLTQSCLTQNELRDYMAGNWKQKFGYWYGGNAIHITKLEIFDKPKEISEFKSCLLGHNNCVPHNCRECPATKSLTRAPQSWCYVEV